MATSLRSYVSTEHLHATTAHADLTLSAPSGIQDNDLLIAFVGGAFNLPSITPPSGWTLGDAQTDTTGGDWLAWYYKIASSESGSYTWSFASRYAVVGAIMCYDGSLLSGTPSSIHQALTQSYWGDSDHILPTFSDTKTLGVSIYGIFHITDNDASHDDVDVWPSGFIEVDYSHTYKGSIGAGASGRHSHLTIGEKYLGGSWPTETFSDVTDTSLWIYFRLTPNVEATLPGNDHWGWAEPGATGGSVGMAA
jgi:hypothetical protein